ncbi:hypothetical protein IT399_00975 [Candidatus Nomurabacteria bacterium]|nr:hypothetical protein [Candidatus Nomurabacteria bacterium]
MNEEDVVKKYKDGLNNTKNLVKIKISTGTNGKPFIKQLKNFNPVWDNCQFFINENIPECDLWVIHDEIMEKESVLCPKNSTLFISAEPPSVKKYQTRFLKQFTAILTCQKNMNHPNLILKQQALPWLVGHKFNKKTDDEKYSKTYDELKKINSIKKNKLISIIVSNKNFTKGHRERLAFLRKLKETLGDKIDVFGIGFNEINDKWDAIAPYKYHICIENSSLEDYWTEKLADAFLGLSYPIYYGCKNIYDYFPNNSLATIDIKKPEEAINKIKCIIDSNTYETTQDTILKAKELILDKYQLFPMLSEYANKQKDDTEKKLLTINPEIENFAISFLRKIRKSLKNIKK